MPWIRKAQIALGIAQTDSWNGVSWMPKLASEPWISRIEAMARKMSSPKNRPTLSVAADIAFTRSAVSSSSLPCCFSAAASAIGATSGRTVCGMARNGRQAERGEDLAEAEIDDQQPARRRARMPRDQRPRPLLQTVAFEQADHRQDDPDDRDICGSR